MGNPYLGDTVERAGRDVVRKLGPEDRLFGTMALAAGQEIEAPNMALGTVAAIAAFLTGDHRTQLPHQLAATSWENMDGDSLFLLVRWLWKDTGQSPSPELIRKLLEAKKQLKQL